MFDELKYISFDTKLQSAQCSSVHDQINSAINNVGLRQKLLRQN